MPLVHDTEQPLSDPFFMMILSHLADKVSEHGYDLLLSKVPVHVDDWVGNAVRSRRADAVIVIGQSLEHEVIDAAALAGVPVVAWGAAMPVQHYATVGSDNHEGGRLAAAHLLSTGRRRLVFLGNGALPEVAERLKGFRQAHADLGVEHNPDLVVEAQFGRDEARSASRLLVASGRSFDGAVCASDLIATALIRALGEVGRTVPEDVGVVGFHDAPLAAYSSPPLTTIRQNVELAAEHLVACAQAAARGEPSSSIEMPVELVIRGSSLGDVSDGGTVS